MRTAFVTGATGFVGQHIVEQLLSEHWRVIALHRASSDLTWLRARQVELVEGTVEDAASLRMPEACDAVFHTVANMSFWSGDEAEQTRTNVLGTRNVVHAALVKHARCFIHTSSDSAYAFQRVVPYDESATSTALESPVNYERTKYQAELEVRAGMQRGLRAVFINPTNILGRYDRRGWVEFLTMIAKNELPAIPPGGMSFCDVEEVARMHLRAVDHGSPGHNYLLGGADATYLELAAAVGQQLGVEVPTRTVPAWLFRALGRLAQWQSYVTGRAPPITPEVAHIASRGPSYVRSDKAIRELGYRVVPLEVMLEKACAWLRESGAL